MSTPVFRRQMFSASAAAALVIGTSTAAGDHPRAADAHLIELCTRYMGLHEEERPSRAVMRGDDAEASEKTYDYCDQVLWKEQDDIVDEISEIPAVSPEAIRAKAQVVGVVLLGHVMSITTQTFDEQAEPHERLVVGLLRDIVGDAGLGWRMEARTSSPRAYPAARSTSKRFSL